MNEDKLYKIVVKIIQVLVVMIVILSVRYVWFQNKYSGSSQCIHIDKLERDEMLPPVWNGCVNIDVNYYKERNDTFDVCFKKEKYRNEFQKCLIRSQRLLPTEPELSSDFNSLLDS